MYRADGTVVDLIFLPPKREDDKHVPAFRSDANGSETLFHLRVLGVFDDSRSAGEDGFDLRLRHAMLSALGPVAFIPIDAHYPM